MHSLFLRIFMLFWVAMAVIVGGSIAATFTITPPSGPARSGSFVATPRPWDGRDHGALVGLLREAAGEMADAVAVAAEAK